MAFSIKTYTGDGVRTDFPVTFDYLDRTHLVVRVNKIETTAGGSSYKFSWINDTSVRVDTVGTNAAVPVGAEIELIRRTPIDSPAVLFGGGAALSSENLNKNSEYLTYALQEATDSNDEFTKLYLGAFDAAPTSDNDGDALQTGAVYYDNTTTALFYWTGSGWIIGESTVAAETFANAAGVSATNAAASETGAAASETGAAANAATAVASSGAAQASATAAGLSEAAAAADLETFGKLYLGPKSSNPSVDNEGATLQSGTIYFKTGADAGWRVWDGSSWQVGEAGPAGPAGPAGEAAAPLVELTQAQVEDDTSTVFGLVTGERLSQSVNTHLNAFAIGAPGATPISVNAFGVFTVGTTRRYYSPAEYTTVSNTYELAFTRSIGGSGTLRLKFDWKNDSANTDGKARILVNGVQVAVFNSTGSFVTTSTDVTLTAGSVIRIEYSGYNGTTTIKNVEFLTNGEDIMFVADQEGVTLG